MELGWNCCLQRELPNPSCSAFERLRAFGDVRKGFRPDGSVCAVDPPGIFCKTIVISMPGVHPSESDKEVGGGTVVNFYNSSSLSKMWALLMNSGY